MLNKILGTQTAGFNELNVNNDSVVFEGMDKGVKTYKLIFRVGEIEYAQMKIDTLGHLMESTFFYYPLQETAGTVKASTVFLNYRDNLSKNEFKYSLDVYVTVKKHELKGVGKYSEYGIKNRIKN